MPAPRSPARLRQALAAAERARLASALPAQPLKVLVMPDKFKGTLSAAEAAQAIARGWRQVRPGDRLELLPMSDGGDGFGEGLSRLLGARARQARTVDARHRPCRARWWWQAASRTALVESATVIGLASLPAGRFHPFELDTYGLGAVLRAAAERGASRCLVGIGGSATNDGGFGLARARGWKFLDRRGREIERWPDLNGLARLDAPPRRRWFKDLVVAVDVQNRLLGPRGATRVYGPQKGLGRDDFARAERALRRLARVVAETLGLDPSREPGSGAAGGLGFGLRAFLGARFESGFDLFARAARLEQRLRWADLVITGEGAVDRSTLMGKGVGEIARLCRRRRVPCLALAGLVSLTSRARTAFSRTRSLVELTTPARAKGNAAFWLERLAAKTAGEG
jgi:glycerate 2-kinase